ncbi:MAG: hypothetical protein SF162_17800 [bacterium]|nr:hypothetical protein [bacterium]
MITQDAASRLGDDIDPELLKFVEQVADSFVKWDLIRFFNDNPHAVDPAEVIARYSSRDVRDVEMQLDELVESKVLRVRPMAGVKAYALAAENDVRRLVTRFVQACDDKRFRLVAIRFVIDLASRRR